MGETMRGPEGFIAVDWGTTNRRAYAIDASGRRGAEFEDGRGVLSIEPGDFPAAVAEIRERLGDKPLLMAGMIGSNKGWVEAPYVACPAGIDELAKSVVEADERALIVPGVCYSSEAKADVMRGEEVQLLGAVAAGEVPKDCTVCHPGTHNKWVRVDGGRIASFRTVLTGELFSLLKAHSILADLLKNEVRDGHHFRAGVRHALETDDLPAELFSVRARVLLGKADPTGAASYASGMLIGNDVKIGLTTAAAGDIFVMGRPDLTSLYAAALGEAGRKAIELDGEQSFVSGITQIAERLA